VNIAIFYKSKSLSPLRQGETKKSLPALFYLQALLSWSIYPIITSNEFIILLCRLVKSNDPGKPQGEVDLSGAKFQLVIIIW
jgi:hypothetical protein